MILWIIDPMVYKMKPKKEGVIGSEESKTFSFFAEVILIQSPPLPTNFVPVVS